MPIEAEMALWLSSATSSRLDLYGISAQDSTKETPQSNKIQERRKINRLSGAAKDSICLP